MSEQSEAERSFRESHTSDGRCKYPKSCISEGIHQRPAPLPGDRRAPDGSRFSWGPIDTIHAVGDFQIVEYRQDRSNHSASQPWCWDSHGETLFHPYINGRSCHSSHRSLDSALVAAIAEKREGPNSRAAAYFDRMTTDPTP